MRFDHSLRPGVATSRNAVRLLERLGYPPAIIAEARRARQEKTNGGPDQV
jgi:DNA mismatch repair ATPase MutS